MATIYKILSPCLQECYVGSTIQRVEERWKEHRKNRNETTSRILLERYGKDCKFVVLEVCPLEEQLEKEQWWIDHSVGTVNKHKAYISEEERLTYDKDYHEANREKHLVCMKANYEANRVERLSYMKAYNEVHLEEKTTYMKAYHEANRERILAQKKAYHEANREKKTTYMKAYNEANRERILAQKKARYQAKKAKNADTLQHLPSCK